MNFLLLRLFVFLHPEGDSSFCMPFLVYSPSDSIEGQSEELVSITAIICNLHEDTTIHSTYCTKKSII